ncbi:MAG TPA: glycosyltransferase family 9 protein, partial [Sumerlaeia bacterium]|nr:glycosyltransferase family 9 protein [Sumerlaeia bacterium]
VDFQGLTKSGWATWRSGAPVRIGFGGEDGREINKWFTNRRVWPAPEAHHVIQRNMALLEPLGIDSASVEVSWRFPDLSQERTALQPFLRSLPHGGKAPAIVLNPGAGWETKRWPPRHFASLARLIAERATRNPMLDRPMILVWGPDEEPLCRDILSAAGLPPGRLVLAPSTNLRELAVLLEAAAAVVGGDTGPVHLAAALGAPVLGIYGASDPVRNGPWGEGHKVIACDAVPCAPCWRTRCNRAESLECLAALSPDRVADAVCDVLMHGAERQYGDDVGGTPTQAGGTPTQAGGAPVRARRPK